MGNFLHFEPCFSLSPNQLTFYNEVTKKKENKETGISELVSISSGNSNSLSNLLNSKFTGFNISSNAYRNLRKKISWLYQLSKSRHVKTYNGKDIYSFKMAFITLTLPSLQKHSTSFITEHCLNQFLTEVRQRTKMNNYVWRLEFQKNGNVHYHLATDTYLDYFFVREIWNRILDKYGYVQEYQNKHKAMSLSQYVANSDSKYQTSYDTLVKRYAKGCSEQWTNPPSVDVKSVINGKSIEFYLSKYFAKDSTDNPIKNDLDNEENSKGLRLWFCSRSLSRLKSISDYVFDFKVDFKVLFAQVENVRKVFLKYCTVFYFNLKDLKAFERKTIEMLFKAHANSVNYQPSD